MLGATDEEPPIVSYAEPRTTSLKGFYIATNPIRLSDLNRSRDTPGACLARFDHY